MSDFPPTARVQKGCVAIDTKICQFLDLPHRWAAPLIDCISMAGKYSHISNVLNQKCRDAWQIRGAWEIGHIRYVCKVECVSC